MNNLYLTKLKSNCSYYLLKRQYKEDLLIVFIGCDDFFITTHYYGCIAIGCRSFDWNKNKAVYKYETKSEEIEQSAIEKVMKKYEQERLQTSATIEFLKVKFNGVVLYE